jgi:hypothetical protein
MAVAPGMRLKAVTGLQWKDLEGILADRAERKLLPDDPQISRQFPVDGTIDRSPFTVLRLSHRQPSTPSELLPSEARDSIFEGSSLGVADRSAPDTS